ncbi:hypothetical protein G3O08_05870 [Cryomorpha ignava]|uniref:Leucine-rich repeat domain-containing protein n=1 Tax=Cryomorpha ignava TaxID=101383 RepID=A0A7K3WN11_9FLAO|nr:hypothetical protein [Cryomorpha ignava]NEN23026.1 hypothetical protein [Cryomorpha ignava]
MMQTIPKWLSLIALWILWTSFTIPVNQSICERIDKNGKLQIKNTDLNNLGAICSCENIRSLSFKKCNFVALPECVSTTKECECTANGGVESISFSKANIQRLPEGLENFNNLQNLDLSFTDIVFLPEDLYQFYELKTLNLRGTGIVSLPDGLENLEMIDMRMIDLSRDDQEAIYAQYPEVKIYFSSPCQCK